MPALTNAALKPALIAAGFGITMNRKEGGSWGTGARKRQTRWVTITVPASRMGVPAHVTTRRGEQALAKALIREVEAITGKLDICDYELFHTDDDCNPVDGLINAYIDTLD